MTDDGFCCALIRPLVSKHRYGAPLPVDELVRMTAHEPHEAGAVRAAVSDLRRRSFIVDRGARGVMVDSSKFGPLADFLYYECDWPTWEIQAKLKHYEGWAEHDWA